MDNRTINQIRNNETKLINEIKQLEQENKRYKEVSNKQKELIDKIKNCFDNGHFEDYCDCLIIEKYINSYFEEVE